MTASDAGTANTGSTADTTGGTTGTTSSATDGTTGSSDGTLGSSTFVETTSIMGTDSTTSTATDPTTTTGSPDTMPGMCDPWAQDCAPGEKCVPYSWDGDDSLESLKCVPVMDNPGQVGDPCTAEGVSGVDSCDAGHMCWHIDPDQGEGVCVEFCTGSPDQPMCKPMTSCMIAGDGVLILCLPPCDPLAPNCLADEVCAPNPIDPDIFICQPQL